MVERSFAWQTRCRRLARNDECLPEIMTGLHLVAFATLMLGGMVKSLVGRSAGNPLGNAVAVIVAMVDVRHTISAKLFEAKAPGAIA